MPARDLATAGHRERCRTGGVATAAFAKATARLAIQPIRRREIETALVVAQPNGRAALAELVFQAGPAQPLEKALPNVGV
jgi:hypothetical protein